MVWRFWTINKSIFSVWICTGMLCWRAIFICRYSTPACLLVHLIQFCISPAHVSFAWLHFRLCIQREVSVNLLDMHAHYYKLTCLLLFSYNVFLIALHISYTRVPQIYFVRCHVWKVSNASRNSVRSRGRLKGTTRHVLAILFNNFITNSLRFTKVYIIIIVSN